MVQQKQEPRRLSRAGDGVFVTVIWHPNNAHGSTALSNNVLITQHNITSVTVALWVTTVTLLSLSRKNGGARDCYIMFTGCRSLLDLFGVKVYWNGAFCKVHLFLVYHHYVYSRCSGFYCLLFACSRRKRLWLRLKRVKTLPNNKLLRIDMRVCYCHMEQGILVIHATMKEKYTRDLPSAETLAKWKKDILNPSSTFYFSCSCFICFLGLGKWNWWEISRFWHTYNAS